MRKAMATLRIDPRRVDEIQILDLRGEVSRATSPRLKDALVGILEENSLGVLLNLREIKRIDMSGLATLIEAAQMCRKNHKRLLLSGVSEPVLKVFEVARVRSAFRIYPDEDSALDATRKIAERRPADIGTKSRSKR